MNEVSRYMVLPVNVTEAGQVIPLDRKLPAHFTHCKGIFVTVKGKISTSVDIPHVGEVSILLNSGQVHPVHHTVGYSTETLQKINPFFPVNEALTPNYRVSGFYTDAGNTSGQVTGFTPYSVNIYLKCKARI